MLRGEWESVTFEGKEKGGAAESMWMCACLYWGCMFMLLYMCVVAPPSQPPSHWHARASAEHLRNACWPQLHPPLPREVTSMMLRYLSITQNHTPHTLHTHAHFDRHLDRGPCPSLCWPVGPGCLGSWEGNSAQGSLQTCSLPPSAGEEGWEAVSVVVGKGFGGQLWHRRTLTRPV